MPQLHIVKKHVGGKVTLLLESLKVSYTERCNYLEKVQYPLGGLVWIAVPPSEGYAIEAYARGRNRRSLI